MKHDDLTNEQITQIMASSQTVAQSQTLVAELKELLAPRAVPMHIAMLAFSEILLEPLLRCVSAVGPDGAIDVTKPPVMQFNLAHEDILRQALQLYMMNTTAIYAAREKGIDLLLPPGKCSGCGTSISANRQKCKACAEADPEQGTASSILSEEPVQ